MNSNVEVWKPVIRHLVSAVAAIIALKGVNIGDAEIDRWVGYVMFAGNQGWMLWSKYREHQRAKAAGVKTLAGLVLACSVAGLMAGCVMTRPHTKQVTVASTNGVTTTTMESWGTAYAVIQGKETLDKMRVSNGKTQSIGMSGLSQETDGVTQAREAFVAGAQTAKAAFDTYVGKASVGETVKTQYVTNTVTKRFTVTNAVFQTADGTTVASPDHVTLNEDGSVTVCWDDEGKTCVVIPATNVNK